MSQARIIAIIVVYKMRAADTPSLVTLQQAAQSVPADRLKLKILVYDNSCDGRDPGPMPEGVEYQAASENAGLSEAYNRALALARTNGYDWLLTLDQDTSLPSNFLVRVTEVAGMVAGDSSIAAIVPLITDSGRIHSPNWFLGGILPRYHGAGDLGVSRHDTYAFNSASMFKVAALSEVGGYNPWFWLDYSDGYIFRQLHRYGKRIYIAADVEVAHNFAMTDLENRVTPSRYRNMRLAESAFWDLEMGMLAGLERTWGLLKMALKHALLGYSPELKDVTYEFLKRRLVWTRKRRLAAWERETLQQFPMLTRNRVPPFL